jgi:hypothetical protein
MSSSTPEQRKKCRTKSEHSAATAVVEDTFASVEATHFRFMDLPLEIKHMILREVFRGSEVRYWPMKYFSVFLYRPNSYAMVEATDHGDILMTNKQCRREGFRLYYQLTELIVEDCPRAGDSAWKYALKGFPETCRLYTHKLTIDCAGLIGFWADSGIQLRQAFPELRELRPGGLGSNAEVLPTEMIHDVLWSLRTDAEDDRDHLEMDRARRADCQGLKVFRKARIRLPQPRIVPFRSPMTSVWPQKRWVRSVQPGLPISH